MRKGATITHVEEGRVISSIYDPSFEDDPPSRVAQLVALVVILLAAVGILGLVLPW